VAAIAGALGGVMRPALAHLYLFDNGIGLGGVEALAPCLVSNDTLTAVDLEENDDLDEAVDPIAAALKAVAEGLARNRSALVSSCLFPHVLLRCLWLGWLALLLRVFVNGKWVGDGLW